jgi:hypothetical protein
MFKHLLATAVFALAASACAPALQRTAAVGCTEIVAHQELSCNADTVARADALQQEPPPKKPPPGPGKKDFTTWMVLITMGFGALYLMAFK